MSTRKQLTGLSNGLVDSVNIPDLTRAQFLAAENLYWTAKALGLHAEDNLQDLYHAGGVHHVG